MTTSDGAPPGASWNGIDTVTATPPPRVGKTHARAMPGLHAGAVIHDLQLEPSATAVRTDFDCAAPGERGDAVDHGVLDQ